MFQFKSITLEEIEADIFSCNEKLFVCFDDSDDSFLIRRQALMKKDQDQACMCIFVAAQTSPFS